MKKVEQRLSERLRSVLRDERGAFVEYLIVVGLVAIVAIAAFKIFGSSVSSKITEQAKAVQEINGQAK